jgi:hypothetical protein
MQNYLVELHKQFSVFTLLPCSKNCQLRKCDFVLMIFSSNLRLQGIYQNRNFSNENFLIFCDPLEDKIVDR